jgi:hypothetical protein
VKPFDGENPRITENYARFRQVDPSKFDEDSFRTKRVAADKLVVLGNEKKSGKVRIQSLLIERKGYWKVKDLVPGGLAKGLGDESFDKASLDEGTVVEMEHTSDAKVAREIARDHLVENPDYYKSLKKLESKDPGLVLKTKAGIPIYAKKLEDGYIYPITAEEVKQAIDRQGDSAKGITSIRFVMPTSDDQRDAFAQYVRGKREIRIFAQKRTDKSLPPDREKVKQMFTSYVIPHEVGHHRAIYKAKITDGDLRVAEARADAHAAGMSVSDRDVHMLVR